MRGSIKLRALTFGVAVAVGLLSAACSSGGSSNSAPSAKSFGVDATGVVHFWARQATDGPAIALVKEFNATHKNLKVVLHLTPPNDDTSQLATAIRAGSPPDVVGLNDIDVPTFSHENALMNITKYVNALPYKNALSPGHLVLATITGSTTASHTWPTFRCSGTTRRFSARPGSTRMIRRRTTRRSCPTPEDQRPRPRHLRLLLRRRLPRLPGLHHAALALGGGPAPDPRPAR